MAHPEGNLGMICSGHGLPRGGNENILPKRKWEYFIQGEKYALSVYLTRRKQKNNEIKTGKIQPEKKRRAMGENSHDKKGVAHPEKMGVASEVTS